MVDSISDQSVLVSNSRERVEIRSCFFAQKTLTAEQRKDATHRLELYQKHQPYRQGRGE